MGMVKQCDERRVARMVARMEASGKLPPHKARLHLVGEGGSSDAAEPIEHALGRRDALREIQSLRKDFRLSWLVRQETTGASNLRALDDQALERLLCFMRRAADCQDYDISYRDAGLRRSNGGIA